MTWQRRQRHMPCHLSIYGTQNKMCTSLHGTIKGESAHVGSFPIIVSKYVVFVKFLCVNTLFIFSSLTAALRVVEWILTLILLHCGNLGAFGQSFFFTKNIGNWKARHQQEAAGASRSRIQKKHIKNFISQSCSNLLRSPKKSSMNSNSTQQIDKRKQESPHVAKDQDENAKGKKHEMANSKTCVL